MNWAFTNEDICYREQGKERERELQKRPEELCNPRHTFRLTKRPDKFNLSNKTQMKFAAWSFSQFSPGRLKWISARQSLISYYVCLFKFPRLSGTSCSSILCLSLSIYFILFFYFPEFINICNNSNILLICTRRVRLLMRSIDGIWN